MIKYLIAFFLFCTFFLLLKSPAVAQSAWCQTQTAVWSDAKQTFSGNVWFLGTCIQPQPADFCDQTGTNWTFYFNPTCTEIKFPCKYEEWLSGYPLCDSAVDGSNMTAPADCTWQQSACDTSDRCQDANVGNLPGQTGAGGGTGSNTTGVILPGVCDLSHFNGINGNTACVSGNWYKSCCNGDGSYGSCNSGTCTNNSTITDAETIACPVPPPPPAPAPILHNYYFCNRNNQSCQLTSSQYATQADCEANVVTYWGKESDGKCYLATNPDGSTNSNNLSQCNTSCANQCVPNSPPRIICSSPLTSCR